MKKFTRGQMDLSENTIDRICKIFGHLSYLEKNGIKYISSKELAKAIGTTEYTVRKDISFTKLAGFTRKGYEVSELNRQVGRKLGLDKKRKACIVGLGRLGTALLDYEKFSEDGFEIVAGFDKSVNKLERIRTEIDVFPDTQMKEKIKEREIELAIITVPAESAQNIAYELAEAGIKGILNFSPVKLDVDENIKYMDMDFTNALRFIGAQL